VVKWDSRGIIRDGVLLINGRLKGVVRVGTSPGLPTAINGGIRV